MPRLYQVRLGLLVSVVLLAPYSGPAFSVEPDDTPWSLDDGPAVRGSENRPGNADSIDDLLARDQLGIIEDNDIAPPSQDQPDYVQSPRPERLEEDRLSPRLPAEIQPVPGRAPELALRPVENPNMVQPHAPPAPVAASPTAAARPEAVAPRDEQKTSPTPPAAVAAPKTTPPQIAPAQSNKGYPGADSGTGGTTARWTAARRHRAFAIAVRGPNPGASAIDRRQGRLRPPRTAATRRSRRSGGSADRGRQRQIVFAVEALF